MIKIVCPWILTKNTVAMTVLCFMILRDKSGLEDKSLINHETIHWRQELETLIIGFYILYLFFYLKNLITGKVGYEAYRSIPFEKEAFDHQDDLTYLSKRKFFAWAR